MNGNLPKEWTGKRQSRGGEGAFRDLKLRACSEIQNLLKHKSAQQKDSRIEMAACPAPCRSHLPLSFHRSAGCLFRSAAGVANAC